MNEKWGVWCVEDRAWCSKTIGTREHAEKELPRWQSGEAADVDPAHFHYELRRYKEIEPWDNFLEENF